MATVDLCRDYLRTGDRRLRNEVVERHLQVADHHVRRFARAPGAAAEDLRQVALLAMVRAVDRFDPEREVEFATFASRTIEGELKRYLRDRTWAVRPPRRQQELHLELRRIEDRLLQVLGRSPSVQELAAAAGEDQATVRAALAVDHARQAYGVPAGEPGGDDRVTAGVSEALEAEGGYGEVVDRMAVADLLGRLPDRDREIVALRFFGQLSQPEIAARVGVSQSYLSRVLRRALGRLRRLAEQDTRPGADDPGPHP